MCGGGRRGRRGGSAAVSRGGAGRGWRGAPWRSGCSGRGWWGTRRRRAWGRRREQRSSRRRWARRCPGRWWGWRPWRRWRRFPLRRRCRVRGRSRRRSCRPRRRSRRRSGPGGRGRLGAGGGGVAALVLRRGGQWEERRAHGRAADHRADQQDHIAGQRQRGQPRGPADHPLPAPAAVHEDRAGGGALLLPGRSDGRRRPGRDGLRQHGGLLLAVRVRVVVRVGGRRRVRGVVPAAVLPGPLLRRHVGRLLRRPSVHRYPLHSAGTLPYLHKAARFRSRSPRSTRARPGRRRRPPRGSGRSSPGCWRDAPGSSSRPPSRPAASAGRGRCSPRRGW